MARRSDLPRNRFLAQDILKLERWYGEDEVTWDREGRWVMIRSFWLDSSRFRFSRPSTFVLIMVPPDYGERRGMGAGLEEFYIHPDLRIIRNGVPTEIPHTFVSLDRRGGAVTAKRWRYACVHIDWVPGRDDVETALSTLALFLRDPWTFARWGKTA